MRLCNGTSLVARDFADVGLLRQKAEEGAYLCKLTSLWAKGGKAIH
jgi:hypothetical protein